MPQSGGRKKPFSSKQKKEQLKAKREYRREVERDEFGKPIHDNNKRHRRRKGREQSGDHNHSGNDHSLRRLNNQPSQLGKVYDQNRYKMHFLKESTEEIQRCKEEARKTIAEVPEDELEVDLDAIYPPDCSLDMPKRPSWDYTMSKQRLIAREEEYFRHYMDSILEQHGGSELSYLEANLETWRQLWRVLEMADVVLLITDIRHPAFHFSPAFYKYVSVELGKPFVLILNKIDLASPALVVAWKQYFKTKYPDINIVCFTSFPRETAYSEDPGNVLHRKRQKNLQYAAGPKELLRLLEKLVQGKVDLSTWNEKMDHEIAGIEPSIETQVEETGNTGEFHTHEAFQDGVLTIGICGYPNVGKSSLINGLMGKKVVSVSKTPGHTKHFQTIFLTPTVKLCDSPGLVFPSLVPKPMQVLSGIYPIAQVRDPYTSVGYLAQRIAVQRLLGLRHPRVECKPHERPTETYPWSAMDICEAWAEKRGFFTAKAARPDIYRAGNHILRLALDGRLCMCTRPPGFSQQRDDLAKHQEAEEIASLQEIHRKSQLADLDAAADDLDELEVTSDSDLDNDDEVNSDYSCSDSEDGAQSSSNPFALLGDE